MTAWRNNLHTEALSRLPELDIGELRQQWRGLCKAVAPPHLSRELLMRAVAYRMQENCSRQPPAGAAAALRITPDNGIVRSTHSYCGSPRSGSEQFQAGR
jgi:hypothetical protein